jgi:cyclopropane-fatty-acyl-phospholipid synthase
VCDPFAYNKLSGSTMSLFTDLIGRSFSLLMAPRSNYDQIRPHHLVVVYGAWRILSSTSLYQKAMAGLLAMASKLSEQFIPLIHAGLVPDFVIRFGIRLQLRDHLQRLGAVSAVQELANKQTIVQELHTMPIAIETDAANQQHYEVPARFYDLCLGPCKKYSSGYWASPSTTFEESEVAMLDLYCERAKVQDGMKIVDLGCGWGSLTLHLAKRYPNAKITGISNSHSQREYILQTAKDRGLNVKNINIVTVRCFDMYCPFLIVGASHF